MRIVTWNVNSVRLRLPLLEKLIAQRSPDVICLQETKVVDDTFPKKNIEAMGFDHIEIRGMKSYNGVAVLSRLPLTRLEDHAFCGRDDCRHLGVQVDGIDLHCLYVPAGGDEPDPETNDKFAHKLQFIDEMAAWSKQLKEQGRPAILTGDFNVAPLETDVWSHKQLLKVVSHTPSRGRKIREGPGRRTVGRRGAEISSRPKKSFIPGGAIARATGRRRIAGGGWTMSGRRRTWKGGCQAPRSCAMHAAGRSLRTMCR